MFLSPVIFILFIIFHFATLQCEPLSISKRQVLPDLNGPPPIESDHSDNNAPATNDQVRQDDSSIVQEHLQEEECDHHKACKHWKSLSEKERKKISNKKWLSKLTIEQKQQKARKLSRTWHSKLTPEQREVRNEKMRIRRLNFKQNASLEQKAARKENNRKRNQKLRQKADSDIQNTFMKRAEIPDLNEFPPPEEEKVQHPNHNQYDLGLIAPVKKIRSKRTQTKRTKSMTVIMQDAKACNHSKSCPHWKKLSKHDKSLQNLKRWKLSLTKERMREVQRNSSRKHRAKWTDEEKRAHYDRDNEQRKSRLSSVTPEQKDAKRAAERERYHKNKDKYLITRKEKRVEARKRKAEEAGLKRSLVISNAKSLNKRAIPDLNGPPPEESEQEEAPLLQSSQTTTIQQQQQPVQPSVNPNPKRKSIFDSTECEHNKKCEHWKALSRTTKRSFQIYRWRKKLPEEERKRRSREQSQRYRKTITPQQKERRKQLAKINRKERMQTMPEDKREKFLAVKNIISKKYYHKIKITFSVSKVSHEDPNRPKYTINLNEPLPTDDEDAGVYISHNLKPNQYLSREEIKATFPTCSHKRGCSHWKQMRQVDKDWSRTRRYRYSKPESIRKAEYRKYTKTYKDKLISNPEQRKAFNKHSNELRAARLKKMNKQERQAYLERKRAITRKSKRKKRDQEIKNSLKRTKE